ncbi:chordin-like [Gigantopelta aegis]|uniref:chordin-like n=1 Tax=Gigantopelta aegis TaxID=1735272 RepID=UPI001B88D78B|nr:chordin-like [Gigantopelta aegis]
MDLVLPLFVLLAMSVTWTGARRSNIPLIGDAIERKQSRTPGCWLGGTFYHLEQRWSPKLLPHGTMHCVKCQCIPIEKKGVLLHRGQIICKNIKLDCPKPDCSNAILLPGKCCKTCPDQMNSFEDNFSFASDKKKKSTLSGDQYEQIGKAEFTALLVGRNVRRQAVTTRSVAVVRITVENRELTYSVRYTRLDHPKFLQITDANGNILVESPIVKKRSGDKKLCGVWKKIPSVYLQYFREKRLFAVITTSRYPKGLVAGRVVPNANVHKETFGSVLHTTKAEGIGGVASLEYNPKTRVVNYAITFDGVFNQKHFNGEYYVTIERNTKIVHQSMGKITRRVNQISGFWKLSRKREAKYLARGRLLLRLTSRNGATISGDLKPRLTCGVFQALLSGSEALEASRTSAAGSVVLELREKGVVDYQIRVSGVKDEVTSIRIEGSASKNNRRRVIGNVHKTFVKDFGSYSGWSNGTFKKMKAEDIVMLLSNQLYINVATTNHRISELRGRVMELPYQESKDEAFPVTLTPFTPKSRGAAAHAWLSMEIGCRLRYEIFVSGFQNNVSPFSILLGSHSNRLEGSAILGSEEGLGQSTVFETKKASGSVGDVPDDLLRDLDEGKAYLQINMGSTGDAVLVANVSLPNTCWEYSNDVDTDILVDEQGVVDPSLKMRCYYEGRYYDDLDHWLPVQNSTCNTCSCVKGSVNCHHLPCPELACLNPVTKDGVCCPTCPDEGQQYCKLEGDLRRHPVGRKWHPFLPQIGFSKCVMCQCKPGAIPECSRLPCPKLTCPSIQRVRRQSDDCCQICDASIVAEPEVKLLKDINMIGACTFMQRVFPHGSKWHPRVAPFGQMKCVNCRCSHGEYTCRRQKCPRLTCKRKIRKANSCCSLCASNQPEEDLSKKDDKAICEFGGRRYNEGEKWRPPASPNGNGRCAICKCKEGNVRCRLRCPKRKCKDPFSTDPCCRQCAERKRQKSRRRNKKNKRGNSKAD